MEFKVKSRGKYKMVDIYFITFEFKKINSCMSKTKLIINNNDPLK
jgi:hypothetical protein